MPNSVRVGLQIPWDKIPCGFDPRPEHSLNLRRDPFHAESLAMQVHDVFPDAAE
jgi:hypothetical protein